MNVSELARQLRIHPQKLLQVLPEFGYDIGAKSIKVDDRVASQIQHNWRRIKLVLEKREQEERDKQRELEKEQRKESGAKVTLPHVLTVRELADILAIPINRLITELMKNGILANQNENIDYDTAVIIAEELGFAVEKAGAPVGVAAVSEHAESLEAILAAPGTAPRPPVIVVMGHVDHGKTKLLDSIRHTDVMAGEAGGITQHIGAYQVVWVSPKTKEKTPLTFIDTPGHEAFTVMRSRGAKVADIAVLVVAADDSVKPQTAEAINIIKAAKLPMVVAINKIDKPGADPKRVCADLAQYGVQVEGWGGDVPKVEISAKQNLNIETLLDTLLIVADMNAEAIKSDPSRPAAGTVIEAHVDKGAGPVATILVQTGTLRINDPLVVNGEIYGKARALKDHRGEPLTFAPPSCPARVLGFKIAPQVGDVLDVSRAVSSAAVDVRTKRSQQTGAEKRGLKQETDDSAGEDKKTLNLVIKADTLGSLEAIIGSLENIKSDEVGVKVVAKGLGNITADDVKRAETSRGMIFGFNVAASPVALEMIQAGGLVFGQFRVIYDLLDRVKDELKKLLIPELITTELGVFKVIALFRTEKKTMIVGGRVERGKLIKDGKARVRRNGEVVGFGKVAELQSGRQSVEEVPEGNECGLQFEGKVKLEAGDVLEVYKEESKEKKLVLK